MITVVGHFRSGSSYQDGQTIKTEVTYQYLLRSLGADRVRMLDTAFAHSRLLAFCRDILHSVRVSSHIVVLPGPRLLRYFGWLIVVACRLMPCTIHLVAIGGWLPSLARSSRSAMSLLCACDAVYVETHRMVSELVEIGVSRARHMPNARNFDHHGWDKLVSKRTFDPAERELRCVFFARVRADKGVLVAAEAISIVNEQLGQVAASLDIYGPIDDYNSEDVRSLIAGFDAVVYKGIVDSAHAQVVISQYDIMLLPTTYPGEGQPGSIIDAYIAGVPVAVTNWKDIPEMVLEGETGFVLPGPDPQAFADMLENLIQDPGLLAGMQLQCRQLALKFHVDSVFDTLLERLRYN